MEQDNKDSPSKKLKTDSDDTGASSDSGASNVQGNMFPSGGSGENNLSQTSSGSETISTPSFGESSALFSPSTSNGSSGNSSPIPYGTSSSTTSSGSGNNGLSKKPSSEQLLPLEQQNLSCLSLRTSSDKFGPVNESFESDDSSWNEPKIVFKMTGSGRVLNRENREFFRKMGYEFQSSLGSGNFSEVSAGNLLCLGSKFFIMQAQGFLKADILNYLWNYAF